MFSGMFSNYLDNCNLSEIDIINDTVSCTVPLIWVLPTRSVYNQLYRPVGLNSFYIQLAQPKILHNMNQMRSQIEISSLCCELESMNFNLIGTIWNLKSFLLLGIAPYALIMEFLHVVSSIWFDIHK